MATRDEGDRRCGVVWHTQGSGKSFTMLFFSGLVVSRPEMNNPTLVVLTDRNDLDDQLFGQFQRCQEILRQTPIQADSVEHLSELLQVSSGGVIFTTVHKFAEADGQFPKLTDRTNVVVMADEAHRSQYGFYARQKKDQGTGEVSVAYGFARNIRDAMPNASFIGFTGTPIELNDKNTRAVFGDYVSIYDIQRAVDDMATVPIYYESRVIKMTLDENIADTLDEDFEGITEREEGETKEKLKTKWAALEAMVGDDERIEILAADLVEHFEKRTEAMNGKGMVVCMSRRICVDLYNAIIKIRPAWHGGSSIEDDSDKSPMTRLNRGINQLSDDGVLPSIVAEKHPPYPTGARRPGSQSAIDDERELVKVIMTGSADDGPEWQQHIRTKERRKKLALQFKNPNSPFKLVIVCDMWLTGFDVPCVHTMYIDKPMQGHSLTSRCRDTA